MAEDVVPPVTAPLPSPPASDQPTSFDGLGGLEERISLTGFSTVNRLRELVSPKGKKGIWLKLLTDRQLAEVYHRLQMGQAVHYIVTIAQKQWKIKKDSDSKSLCRALRWFRDQVVGALRIDPRKTTESHNQRRALKARGKHIVEKLDGLGRLRWLIQVQTERVESLREKEKASLPFKFTGKEVKILGELLDSYIKYQLELGLLDAKPSEHSITMKHRFEGLMGNALQGGGYALVDAAHKFLEMAEQKALTLQLGKDGAFSLKPPASGENEMEEWNGEDDAEEIGDEGEGEGEKNGAVGDSLPY